MTTLEGVAAEKIDPKLGVSFRSSDFSFTYAPGVFGPLPEHRSLDAIRGSLRDPKCSGPNPVYSIVMDVGRTEHREELHRRMLLFGVVAYASGRLGDEPVRSQGHIHSVAPHCGWSTPELFEIWQGKAIIYAQERVEDAPGRCIVIAAGPGDKVVVPPGWGHYVANASPETFLVFGAWCDRQYGFDYRAVREHGGLAWFPVLAADSSIRWEPNGAYRKSELSCRRARSYPELSIEDDVPIYEQFAQDADRFQWVSDPGRMKHLWPNFEP
jgi:glucose-6-phosphate isomerase